MVPRNRRDTSRVVTKLRRRDTTLPRMYAVSTAVGNAVPCSSYILDTTGTTYTFYVIEKQKKQSKKEKTNRKRKRRTNRKETGRNNLSCPAPRRRGGQHLKKNQLEKNKIIITKTPE